MKKKRKRLSITSHGDVAFLWVAIKHYGDKLLYDCHWGERAARDRGDTKEAERCQKLYQETQRRMDELMAKLARIQEAFEREMPFEPDPDDLAGGPGGVSHAGMLDGN